VFSRIGSDEPRSIAAPRDVGTTCRKYEDLGARELTGSCRVAGATEYRRNDAPLVPCCRDRRRIRRTSSLAARSESPPKEASHGQRFQETALQRSGTISPKDGTLSTQGRLRASNGPRLPLREPRAGIASGDGRTARVAGELESSTNVYGPRRRRYYDALSVYPPARFRGDGRRVLPRFINAPTKEAAPPHHGAKKRRRYAS